MKSSEIAFEPTPLFSSHAACGHLTTELNQHPIDRLLMPQRRTKETTITLPWILFKHHLVAFFLVRLINWFKISATLNE